MGFFKKLIFGLLFLLSWAYFFRLSKGLQDYSSLLSFSPTLLVQTTEILLFLILASLFFAIFVALSLGWIYNLLIIFLASLIPFLFLQSSTAIITAIGTLESLMLAFFLLNRRVETYIAFQPAALLMPTVNQVATLILLVITLTFYLNTATDIKKNGFKLPDVLINTSLQLANNQIPAGNLSNLQIPASQLALVKNNSQLLKQYGLDPSILDSIPTSSKNVTSDNVLKSAIQTQMQEIINPYLSFIPITIAILFFLSLKSLTSLLLIPLPAIIILIFWFLEKIGFTKYQIETREVKKLMV